MPHRQARIIGYAPYAGSGTVPVAISPSLDKGSTGAHYTMSRMRLRITYNGLPPGKQPTLLGKIAAVAAGVAVLGVAFLFSVVLLTVLLAVGIVGGGYIWWRTRALRKQLRERAAAMQAAAAQARAGPQSQPRTDEIIEGEYSRMPEGPAHDRGPPPTRP
jgi:hypothetical protein